VRNPHDATDFKRQAQAAGAPVGAIEAVSRYLRSNRFEAAFGTTRGIAMQCGVSNAAVVRAAQQLGYSGFRELRQALRQSLGA